MMLIIEDDEELIRPKSKIAKKPSSQPPPSAPSAPSAPSSKTWKYIVGLVVVIGLVFLGYKQFLGQEWPINDTTPQKYTEDVLQKYAKSIMDYKMTQVNSVKVTKGEKYVIANRLCIRKDPSMNQKPLGLLVNKANVRVVEVVDDEWSKIEIPLMSLRMEKDKKKCNYYDANGNLVIEADKELSAAVAVFVASRYLSDTETAEVSVPINPQNPFTYALLFYNKEKARMLEAVLWKNLKNDLQALGFDGVKVVFDGKSETRNDLFNSGKVHGMEDSAYNFYKIGLVDKTGKAFAKMTSKKEAARRTYSSFILINKDSNIKSLKDLKGKIIFTGNENSATSYKIPLKVLADNGIKKEDLKLYKGFKHQEMLPIIADKIAMNTEKNKVDESGIVPDAVFVGDFIMLSSTFDEFDYIKRYGFTPFKNIAELKAARDNVYILPIKLPDIPNCAHFITNELYAKEDFRNKLRNVIIDFYDKYDELSGMAEATTDEYMILKDYEE